MEQTEIEILIAKARRAVNYGAPADDQARLMLDALETLVQDNRALHDRLEGMLARVTSVDPMTGEDHFKEAERLVAYAAEEEGSDPVALALVHAILAHAAAQHTAAHGGRVDRSRAGSW